MALTEMVPTATISTTEPRRRRRRNPNHRLRQPEPRVLPLQPLLAVSGLSRRQLQVAIHRSGSDVAKAACDGITATQAYTWCDRLRLHPTEVWGPKWWEVDAA